MFERLARRRIEKTSEAIMMLGQDLHMLGISGNERAATVYLNEVLDLTRVQHSGLTPEESKREFLKSIYQVARWADLGEGDVKAGKSIALNQKPFQPSDVFGLAGEMVRRVAPHLI